METNNVNKMQSIDPRYNYYDWEAPVSQPQSIPTDPTLTSVRPPVTHEQVAEVKIDRLAMEVWDMAEADLADPALFQALGVTDAKAKLLAALQTGGLSGDEQTALEEAAIEAYLAVFTTLAEWENDYGWIPGMDEKLQTLRLTILKDFQDYGSQLLAVFGEPAKELLTALADMIDGCCGKVFLEPPPVIVEQKAEQSAAGPALPKSEPADDKPAVAAETEKPAPPPPPPKAPTAQTPAETEEEEFGYSPDEEWGTVWSPDRQPVYRAETTAFEEYFGGERRQFSALQKELNNLALKVETMTARWVLEATLRQLADVNSAYRRLQARLGFTQQQ